MDKERAVASMQAGCLTADAKKWEERCPAPPRTKENTFNARFPAPPHIP